MTDEGLLDSLAVIVEYISFLRKQVIGDCNGLAEKAGDMRGWGIPLRHVSQKTYRERFLDQTYDQLRGNWPFFRR